MGTYFHANLRGGQNLSFPTLFDSYRELLLNPNAAEWPACMLSDLKNSVSGAETQQASVEVKEHDW